MDRFCVKCGEKLKPNQKFCINCGADSGDKSNDSQSRYNSRYTNNADDNKQDSNNKKMTMQEYAETHRKPKKGIGCFVTIIFLAVFLGFGFLAGSLSDWIGSGPYGKITGIYYTMLEDKILFVEIDDNGGKIISLEDDNKLYNATKSKKNFFKTKYELEFTEYIGDKNSKYILNIIPDKYKFESQVTYIENGKEIYKKDLVFKELNDNKYYETLGVLEEDYIGKYKGVLTLKEVYKKNLNKDDEISFNFEIGKSSINKGHVEIRKYDSEIAYEYKHETYNRICYKGDVIEIQHQEYQEYDDPEFGSSQGTVYQITYMRLIPINGSLVGYFDLYSFGKHVASGEVKIEKVE